MKQCKICGKDFEVDQELASLLKLEASKIEYCDNCYFERLSA